MDKINEALCATQDNAEEIRILNNKVTRTNSMLETKINQTETKLSNRLKTAENKITALESVPAPKALHMRIVKGATNMIGRVRINFCEVESDGMTAALVFFSSESNTVCFGDTYLASGSSPMAVMLPEGRAMLGLLNQSTSSKAFIIGDIY